MPPSGFTPQDLAELKARGVAPSEAERQLALLAAPPGYRALDRPAAIGDGIERVDEARREALAALAEQAARAGRVSAFTPASGAASRMFRDLLACLADPTLATRTGLANATAARRDEAFALGAFLEGLERFAFFPALAAQLDRRGTPLARLLRRGEVRPLLEALLEPGGLGFAAAPKGLIPFHREGALVRTAFEEHLVEAATLARDSEARARTHFTLSDEHRVAFQRELERGRPRLERELDSVWDATFSIQSPATDTLAADPRGGAFRGADGRLLFRPAGHGALIGNLAALGADVVWIKNIDNVASAPFKPATYEWARVLIGRVVELEREVRGHAESLAQGAAPDGAERFLQRAFGVAPEDGDAAERRERASTRLARPLRACGMVQNTGEPGGGPFWVREASGGVSLQIVESAEIDPDDASQREQFAHGTHFNPVLMAVALRDPSGSPWPLARFVDENAVIVTRKSSGGRHLLALERPGLWNGAMAHWNSVFIEVPLTAFNPVKTVNDLLRPEHQP